MNIIHPLLSTSDSKDIFLSSDAGILIFLYRNEGTFIITIISVDDAIFCGPNKSLVYKLMARFMARWECQNLGEVTSHKLK